MSCVLARFMKMRSGNSRVAIMANKDTLEMRNAEGAEGSPNVSYAAVVDPPRRSTRSGAAPHAASPVGGGNKAVADDTLGAKPAKPPSPPAPATDAAPAEDGPPPPATKEQLAAKDAEIHDLEQQLANHPASQQLKADKADPPSPPTQYSVATSENNKIKLTHGPKPKADSTTGLTWVGYCIEGCVCATCVAKRAEPSKTEMHNSKRVSKEPSS